MKKFTLLFCSFCLAFSQIAFAQEPKVPMAVTNAFNEKYPDMKVTDWDHEKDKNAYSAEFKMNGKEMEAWFGADGQWMKTKSDIKREQLPVAVTRNMTTGAYSTWTMSDYMEMDTPEGKRYKIKAKKGSEEHYLKFDSNGTLLEKMDKADKKKR